MTLPLCHIFPSSYVRGPKAHQRLRPTRRTHKLDVQPVGVMNVNNGTEVSPAQSMLREVSATTVSSRLNMVTPDRLSQNAGSSCPDRPSTR